MRIGDTALSTPSKSKNKLQALADADNANMVHTLRKAQVGSGMRGDKIRTYREQDDQVTDHQTGKQARLKDVLRGRLQDLI